jgi:hypothetical protein
MLIELPKLPRTNIGDGRERERGGARPQACVREKDGHLAIAKFSRQDDEINTVVWEAVGSSTTSD